MFRIIFSFLLIMTLTNASAQIVSTVAGVLESPGSEDGNALSSRFNNPHGIAIDNFGNVYVADRYNHVIRKVSTDGIVSTLAGVAGEGGDMDGSASQARFLEPWGICVGTDNYIYIADTKNNKIRKISMDGTVTTLAGDGNFASKDGVGENASFGNPTGLEMNEAGDLFVADHRTHTIRKITPDGTVTTMAGTAGIPGDTDGTGTDAQFWRPYGLTLDLDGNILIADEWNHKIKKMTPGGVVTTLAGTGELGLQNGSAEQATFNYPWDVTIDKQGNIYVTDGYNYVLRKIKTDNNITTFAGTPLTYGGANGPAAIATFNGAASIAFNGYDDCIYIGDAYNHLIRKITVDEPSEIQLALLNTTPQICQDEIVEIEVISNINSNFILEINSEQYQTYNDKIIELNHLLPGSHTLLIKTENNGQILYSNSININILPNPTPNIEVEGSLILEKGSTVNLIAQTNNNNTYIWSNGSTSESITVDAPGTYYITETSVEGCQGTSENIEVRLLGDEATDWYLPSAFTPNGDGHNDFFRPLGNIPAEFILFIYNQWGEVIFQTNDPVAGWDGKCNGKYTQNGTYTFLVQYKKDNSRQITSGHITLIR